MLSIGSSWLPAMRLARMQSRLQCHTAFPFLQFKNIMRTSPKSENYWMVWSRLFASLIGRAKKGFPIADLPLPQWDNAGEQGKNDPILQTGLRIDSRLCKLTPDFSQFSGPKEKFTPVIKQTEKIPYFTMSILSFSIQTIASAIPSLGPGSHRDGLWHADSLPVGGGRNRASEKQVFISI
jgi:hypothetical protein